MTGGEEKAKRRKRYLVWIFVLATVALFLYPFVSFYDAIHSHRQQIATQAFEMRRVISAINQHRTDRGTFPASLEDVFPPDRVQALHGEGWSYHSLPPPEDEATLEISGSFHSRLGYNFISNLNSPTKRGWWYTEEGSPVSITFPP